MSKGNCALDRRLTAVAVNDILRTAVTAAGLDDPSTYSATIFAPGSSSTPTPAAPPTTPSPTEPATAPSSGVDTYIRTDTAWDGNAAIQLGL